MIEKLHRHLPADHLPIWERLRSIPRRFGSGAILGAWVGTASHLAIDSHIDGFTSYKDLPFAIPTWGHHLIMDVNAAAAGTIGWFWYDRIKRRFRREYPVAPIEESI